MVLGRLTPINPGTRENDEELLRSLLDHYGFSHLTKPRREHLAKVLGLRHSQAKESRSTEGAPSNETH